MEETLAKLMEQNLALVWNETNSEKRLENLKKLYVEDCILVEFGETTKGYEAINKQVDHVITSMPAGFVFTQQKPVDINYDMGRLTWGAGPAGGSVAQLGMDVAIFEGDRIKSLHVFLEK